MNLDILIDQKHPADPAFAPDGRIAFTAGTSWSEPGKSPQSRIWIASADGSGCRQATRGPGVDSHPCWSPDGRVLAFASDRDHEGRMSVHLLEAGGEAAPVGDIPGSVEQVVWDPEGRRLMVLAADPGSDRAGADSATRLSDGASHDPEVRTPREHWRRLYLIDAGSGVTTQVPLDAVNVWEFDWLGGEVAAVVSDDPSESGWYDARIALLDPATGEQRTLHEPVHQVSCVRLSPDGDRVAFVEGFCSDRGILVGDACVVPTGGGAARVLSREPDVGNLGFAAGRLWFAAVNGLDNACGWFGDDGRPHTAWAGPASLAGGWIPNIAVSADGKLLAAAHSSWAEPPELRVLDTAEPSEWRALSQLNSGLGDRPLPNCERVTWSAADGLEIEGLLIRPAGVDGPLPLLVKVHGGPTSSFGWEFPGAGDVWPAEAGYALLLPNPRGSAGRGQEFALANLGDMGGGDLADILAGIESLVDAGIADTNRVGILGGSYGGFMAAWAITQTDRFAASIPMAAVTDWLSFHNTTNIGRFDELFLNGDPYDPESDYLPRSPIMHVRRVHTPTLVMHGELDLCVPVSQAHELYRALADEGVTTELVVYPREGHGWKERDHVLDGIHRQREWFDRHLAADRAAVRPLETRSA
ncbi:MAG: prolyl oligopeptidase family serine peptidase [Gaiellales bacterium]